MDCICKKAQITYRKKLRQTRLLDSAYLKKRFGLEAVQILVYGKRNKYDRKFNEELRRLRQSDTQVFWSKLKQIDSTPETIIIDLETLIKFFIEMNQSPEPNE